MKPGIITGLHGCNCHPFSSWKECHEAHRQRFRKGHQVNQRHTGASGEVYESSVDGKKEYVIVKYGPRPADQVLEHVAMLIKI